MAKIKVLIIDDNRVFRRGLVTLFNEQSDMIVVSSIGCTANVLVKAKETLPNVILIDIGVKRIEATSLSAKLKKILPDAKVIGMGLLLSETEIVEFIESGATGLILKNSSLKDYLDTIRSVAQGRKVLPSALTDSLFSQIIEHGLKKGKGKILQDLRISKLELEVLLLVGDGFSNEDVSSTLKIKTHSVKSHIHNILEKLALQSRIQTSKLIPAGKRTVKK